VTHRQVRVKQQCPKQKLAESRGLPNVWPEESAMSTGLEGEVSRKGSGLRAWQTLAYSFPSPSPSLLDPWVLHTYLFFRCRAPRPGARAAFPCIGDLQELTSRKLFVCLFVCLFLFAFSGRISCSPGWPHVAQAGHRLTLNR